MADDDCRCPECAAVHMEFIAHFGKWPHMSHAEGQRIKNNRIENEASWRRLLGPRSDA